MDPDGKHGFDDLCSELEVGGERVRFMERIAAREITWMPATQDGGRDMLLEVISRAVSRIELLLAAHDERNNTSTAGTLDRLAFDDTDDGERLRRYQLGHGRLFVRTVAAIFKVRKDLDACGGDREPSEVDERNESMSPAIGRTDEENETPVILRAPTGA